MASNHYFLELEPPAERLRHAPHVVIVGGGFAGVHACKAAMDYYAHQLSGLPQTQELLDTREASVADSEAAIK